MESICLPNNIRSRYYLEEIHLILSHLIHLISTKAYLSENMQNTTHLRQRDLWFTVHIEDRIASKSH